MSVKQLDFSAAEKAFDTKLIEDDKKGAQALHETVVAYQANRRSGTHATKTKALVSGSGKKPWRQKGTGNARSGYKSSTIWRGGGVVFGPQPRDYSKVTPKKVKKLALKKAFSEAAKSKRLQAAADLKVDSGKTKDLVSWIRGAKLPEHLLIITDQIDRKLILASRNIPKVEVVNASEVNAEQICRYKQVVLLEKAAPLIAQRIK
ncbi:MAG: 50S ribosomal protein L4 [Verrucomicrobiota bacterium]